MGYNIEILVWICWLRNFGKLRKKNKKEKEKRTLHFADKHSTISKSQK